MKKTINLLQNYLSKKKIDVFFVPKSDEFLSEFISPYADRLFWISNFSGSSGIGVIFQNKAAVFTDGRYTIQIKKEVDKNYFEIQDIKNLFKWINIKIKQKSIVAIDPKLFSKNTIEKIEKSLSSKSAKFLYVEKNPIDLIWRNQPKRLNSKAFDYKEIYAGKSRQKKILEIQKCLKKYNCNYYLFTALDSIAWLLNLRGSDFTYTPLNYCFLILPSNGKPSLFINKKKLDNFIKTKLLQHIKIFDFKYLEKGIDNIKKNSVIGIDKDTSSYWYIRKLNILNHKIKYIKDPCLFIKSKKNYIEINGTKNANLRDGVSFTKFLFWLKNSQNLNKINEISASNKLLSLRKKNKLYFSLSFETISAFGSNAALPHYKVTKKSNTRFLNNNIYLIDSGAQYLDGTTDITRTILLGDVNKEIKDRFTRVLKGHIAIACKKFSKKTKGSELDKFARKSLKEIGCDYSHGTGHGIGCFLNVHEGPQRISKYSNKNEPFLDIGMIISNEPGFYKEGEYGIRIENTIIVKNNSKDKNSLIFETISFVPIDRDLILKEILNVFEKKWINDYHQLVYKKLSKKLSVRERIWLKKVTRPI